MFDPKEDELIAEWVNFACFVVYAFGLIAFAMSLQGCVGLPSASSIEPPAAELAIEKLDLPVTINGQEFPGWGVAAAAESYEVTIRPSERVGWIQWRTCDRSDEINRGSRGFFGDLFGSRDTSFTFSYTPDPNLDRRHHCPLEIDVLTSKKEHDGFAVIEFEDARPEYVVTAELVCNGKTKTVRGVAMCQSRESLMQSITFDRPVVAMGISPECDVMKDLSGDRRHFRFAIARGKCLYTFVAQERAENGERKALRFFTHGYNDVPTRE